MLYQLSYAHQVSTFYFSVCFDLPSDLASEFLSDFVARPAGVEPAARGLEGRCSIQLSYGRMLMISGGYGQGFFPDGDGD